jgi:DNA-binding protein, histone-like, putative
MSQKYKLVKRYSKPGDTESEQKYYAVAVSSGVSDINHLARLIGARSTVSSADVKAVLDNLNFVMDVELRAGRIVKIGELGTFRLSVCCRGAETEAEFNHTFLRKGKIRFTPGQSLKDTVGLMSFSRVSNTTGSKASEEGGLNDSDL